VSRNMNRIGITVVAAAGLFGGVPVVGAIATADPAAATSPGVPCMDIVAQLAASPAEIQQPLQNAATSLVAAPLVDAVGVVAAPAAATPVVPLANPVGALPIPPIPTGPLPGPIVAPVWNAAAVVPEPDAAPVEDAADVEAADVLVDDGVPAVAAPIEDAAGVVPPPPVVPVVPDVGSLASMVPSALPVPSVPGIPVPLPQAVSLPHDFICAGTAWSASKSTPSAGAVAPGKAVVSRRDW